MESRDLVIIGGGPAGLAAAISAYDNGVKDVLIIERESKTGGVLKQCIHNGFGLTRFGENLTGPEYAYKFIEQVESRNIEVLTDTFVLDLTDDKVVTYTNTNGIKQVKAKAVILAMGCRERSKGALNISGTRPAGIFSAGTAQKYVNVNGVLPGKRVVILGSGDIGLIMARRTTLEGAKVLCVSEIMPYSSGLKRNIEQCLNDFDIPLYLSHTIVEIEGKERVTGVVIAEVDQNKKAIPGTEMHFDCDTVLFSVGLIPENELSSRAKVPLSNRTKGAIVDNYRETEVDGIFACGNALHVHDLVDFVSEEAETAGKAVAKYIQDGKKEKDYIECEAGDMVSYVLPQKMDRLTDKPEKVYFRVRGAMKNCYVKIDTGTTQRKIKKLSVAPGEMESVMLTVDQLRQAKYINVSIEKGDN